MEFIKIFIIAAVAITAISIIGAVIYALCEPKINARADKIREEAKIKEGEKYEFSVSKKLEKALGTEILRNIIIEFDNGSSTEIDLLFVNRKGIFVIECKSRVHPHIFGVFNENVWHNGEYEFENPLMQNARHIRALSHLDFSPQKNDIYRNVIITNTENEVIYFGKAYKGEFIAIPEYDSMIVSTKTSNGISLFANAVASMPDILTPKEVATTIDALRDFQADAEAKARHVSYVKSRQSPF